MKIIISESKIKAGAAADAVAVLGLDVGLNPVVVEPRAGGFSSGINEQPFGRLETARGATNRAERIDRDPEDYAIGVENGIVRSPDSTPGFRYEDVAYVVVIAPSGRRTVVCSEAARVPDDIVEKSRATGWSKTCGRFQAEISGCDHADPHVAWVGKPRREILAKTIATALSIAISAERARVPTFARVEIAGLVRALPVRRVGPGVHLGILKLAGDAELTEAAGLALVQMVPADVDALVMPDGKAQPLLHVMQRELSRLRGRVTPAMLARKDVKSYMAQPIASVASTSITSRQRSFYLDADDIEALRGRKVALVDDVVSSGGTYESVGQLLLSEDVGVRGVVEMAVATEGDAPRPGVIALANLKVFLS